VRLRSSRFTPKHWYAISFAILVGAYTPQTTTAQDVRNALREANYTVFSGDGNSDGINDYLFIARDQIALVDEEVSVPILLRWRSNFVAWSHPDGTFFVERMPSLSVIRAAHWMKDQVKLSFVGKHDDRSGEMTVEPIYKTGGGVIRITLAKDQDVPRVEALGGLGTNAEAYRSADSSIAMSTLASPSSVAGATRGTFSVGPLGEARYEIPLWLPRAANALQPEFSLQYSSTRAQGIMGPGWSLNGLGSISRCPKTRSQDGDSGGVNLTTGDGLCLDGQRLRLVSGIYGTSGSTYATELATFSRITAQGSAGNGPSHFIVETKDGLTREYGNSNDGGATNTARIAASGSSTPYSWVLNKVRDRNGNNYVVSYGTAQPGSVGVGVPLSVRYSPVIHGATSFRYEVQFTYQSDTADGTEVRYLGGGSTVNSNLLVRVDIKRLDIPKTLRSYGITYELSPSTNRRRLASVQECSDSTLTSCFEASTAGYQNGTSGVGQTATTPITSASSVKGAHDLNGDGRDDIIYLEGGTLRAAISTPTGYGAPINTGISVTANDFYEIADLVGSGKQDILATQGNTWYRYYWNGSSFVAAATGVTVAADERSDIDFLRGNVPIRPVLTDINGDGLPDLVTKSKSGAVFTIYTRLNTSSNGTFQLAATRVAAFTKTISESCAPYPCINALSYFNATTERSSSQKIDFNSDGKADIAWNWIVFANADGNIIPRAKGTHLLGHNSNTLSQLAFLQNLQGYFVNWNDDGCTDFIGDDKSIRISACTAYTVQGILFTEQFVAVMDWNGDGRSDLIVKSGNNLGVRLSTGQGIGPLIATSVPAPQRALIGDFNGDGLDDLAGINNTSPTPVSIRLHNGVDQTPDLLTSITDGHGIGNRPSYSHLPNGPYTKGSGATFPYVDVVPALTVVRSVETDDGRGGEYTTTYSYAGARRHLQGRGFMGFKTITATDSRPSSMAYTDTYNTDFPTAGLLIQRDLRLSGNSTLVSRVTAVPDVITLSATANQQRYFPYVKTIAESHYEVGGLKNGQLIKTKDSTLTMDSFGNTTSSVMTWVDKDASTPQSPLLNNSFTVSVSKSFAPNQLLWCLNIPTRVTVSNGGTSIAQIARTTSIVPDYAKCRIIQETVEPDSATYKVTIDHGYDIFGNQSSRTVTGQGMLGRQETLNWGTSGQFVTSATNALNQTTTIVHDLDVGLPSSLTDPNGTIRRWTYDEFGRLKSFTRPDSTAIAIGYSKCSLTSGGCEDGNPTAPTPVVNRTVLTREVKDTAGNTLSDQRIYLDQLDRMIVEKTRTLEGNYSRIGYVYDSFGRRTHESVPCLDSACSLFWKTTTYDALGRSVLVQKPVSDSDGTLRSGSFSYAGMTTTVTDALGKTTTVTRDLNDKPRTVRDHNGYVVSTTYDAFGNVLGVTDSLSNTLFTATYDYGLFGFRRQSNEMNLGLWTYTPNALGEITSYQDAKGSTVQFTYDKLSRPLTRSSTGEATTTWIWGTSAAARNIGRLQSIGIAAGPTESYSYDGIGRISKIQIVSDATYEYEQTYHSTSGNVDSIFYPSSTAGYRLKLKYFYQNGYLKSIADATVPATVYWQSNATNPRSQTVSETFGNGVTLTSGFDAVSGRLEKIEAGVGGGNALQHNTYAYDKVGNLTQRRDVARNLTEDFVYDNLHRLDYSRLNGVTNLDMSYDAMGNITNKCEPACGANWTYHPIKKHAVTQANVAGAASAYTYDQNGNAISRNGHPITWNKFNYPTILQGQTGSVALSYDGHMRRWKQVTTENSASETTIYIGNHLEKVSTGSSVDWRHSIWANGKKIAIVSRQGSGVNTTRYILEDHQGSASKVLSASGSVNLQQSFSAFGMRRGALTWSGSLGTAELNGINSVSRDGFTGHTALGNLDINHLHGRVHDTVSGRFLSPDPYVMEADTQGFNRYSYVENNPLSFRDPTGFEREDNSGGGVFSNGYQLSWEEWGDLFESIGDFFGDVLDSLLGSSDKKPPPLPPPSEPGSPQLETHKGYWFDQKVVEFLGNEYPPDGGDASTIGVSLLDDMYTKVGAQANIFVGVVGFSGSLSPVWALGSQVACATATGCMGVGLGMYGGGGGSAGAGLVKGGPDALGGLGVALNADLGVLKSYGGGLEASIGPTPDGEGEFTAIGGVIGRAGAGIGANVRVDMCYTWLTCRSLD
jgi:RHS repeat-associated protein